MWLNRLVVVVLYFECFWPFSSWLKQKMLKNVKNRNSSTWAGHVGSLLKHVVSGTTPLSRIPASDGKGNNQESQYGAGAEALVWVGSKGKGAVSVFIQLAAFLRSDSPQRHHRVRRFLLGWARVTVSLFCVLNRSRLKKRIFFFC